MESGGNASSSLCGCPIRDNDDGDNIIAMQYPTGRVINIARDGIRRISAVNGGQQTIASNMVLGKMLR